MAYIKTIDPAEATGQLQIEYEAAVARAGRVWNIVRIMSPNPPVLAASMQLYREVLYGESPLSRRQREMLAVVTSTVNGCHY